MDWKNIISELLSTGLTQAQIAHASGVSQPTIAGLLGGSQQDMKWTNGHRLLSFYRETVRGAVLEPKEPEHA